MSTAKTEPPTPRRLRELRARGDVPHSRELDKTAALLGALVALFATGPATVGTLAEFTAAALGGDMDPLGGLTAAGVVMLRGALPPAGAAAIAAMAAGAVQTGAVFAPGRLLPDAGRMRPGEAWQSQLRLDTLVSATMAIMAAVLGAAAAAVAVSHLVDSAPHLAEVARLHGPGSVAALVADEAAVVGAAWLGIAAIGAMVDAGWQRAAFLRRHRMSLQEVRDEYRQSEGDPAHKARRARAHRELLASSVRDGVARADVIVTNPVRVAVGLRYRPDEVDAPTVTVAGRGETARAIRREALRKRVPEYMDRRVARAIVELEVGDEVPETVFEPVAVVFRWLRDLEEHIASPVRPAGDADR